MNKKLSERTWWMVLWLILFFPVGLYLLWAKHPEMKQNTKIIITVIIIILVIIGTFSKKSNNNQSYQNKTNNQNQNELSTQETTEQIKREVEATTEYIPEATTEEKNISDQQKDELSKLKGKSVKKGKEKLNETGYTIRYLNQGEDFTEMIDDFNDNIITDISIKDSDKTITVDIISKEAYELQNVSDIGRNLFMNIDWDNVFAYKSKVHYILDYSCQESKEEFKKYGKYVAIASADLQNQYGAEFNSHVYIFMDKKGNVKHIFYDEADGSATEIDKDNVPMK